MILFFTHLLFAARPPFESILLNKSFKNLCLTMKTDGIDRCAAVSAALAEDALIDSGIRKRFKQDALLKAIAELSGGDSLYLVKGHILDVWNWGSGVTDVQFFSILKG